MNEIKKIISKVFLLIIDILRFGNNTTRQVILPCKRKKGNLLSSLFIFFVGIIERLDNFEYGVFQMANLLRRKYVKQTLLIIAAILFLLSSFEWTGGTNVNANSCDYITRISDTPVENIVSSNYADALIYSTNNCLDKQFPTYKIIAHSRLPFTSPVKKILLIQCIRI